MDPRELKRLAQLGAASRLAELERERKSILAAFPSLARSVNGAAPDGHGARRARGRRPMSAAERRAVSVRMKKYWAARRRES